MSTLSNLVKVIQHNITKRILVKHANFDLHFQEHVHHFVEMVGNIFRNIECGAVQKWVNVVDIEICSKTSTCISLEKIGFDTTEN